MRIISHVYAYRLDAASVRTGSHSLMPKVNIMAWGSIIARASSHCLNSDWLRNKAGPPFRGPPPKGPNGAAAGGSMRWRLQIDMIACVAPPDLAVAPVRPHMLSYPSVSHRCCSFILTLDTLDTLYFILTLDTLYFILRSVTSIHLTSQHLPLYTLSYAFITLSYHFINVIIRPTSSYAQPTFTIGRMMGV